MTPSCRYLEVYDLEEGGLTEWGRRVWTQARSRRFSDAFDTKSKRYLHTFRERHDLPPEPPLPEAKLDAVLRWLDENEFPRECPHEVARESDLCLFHLDPVERREREIAASEIRRHFLQCVRGERKADSSDGSRPMAKCFVGAKLGELDLRNQVIRSRDNRPIDLRLSRLEALSLDHATVGQPLQIEWATVSNGSFVNTQFDRAATFSQSVFDGDELRFRGARFTGANVDFSEVEFRASTVDFGKAEFHGDVTFARSDFGEDPGSTEEVTFHRARFANGDADFSGVTFAAPTGPVKAFLEWNGDPQPGLMEDPGGLDEAALRRFLDDRYDSLTGSQRSFDFKRTRFDGGDVIFARSEFGGRVNFGSARFSGGHAKFTGVKFGGDDTNFGRTEFRGEKLDFRGAKFGLEISFMARKRIREFTGKLLDDPDVESRREAEEIVARFVTNHFGGERVDFSGAAFETGEVDFQQTEFTLDHVSFVDSDFQGTTAAFSDAAFHADDVDFSRLGADSSTIHFKRTRSDSTIRMREARIGGGEFHQAPGDGRTLYDFEEATVGNLLLDAEGDTRVLDCFRFYRTDFDGFDFSRYNDDLSETNWLLHQTVNRDGSSSDSDGFHGEERAPGELEATYMKAKIGAKRVGHAKAVAEFFQKELYFRRHKYARTVRSSDASLLSRMLATWRWLANFTLWVITGYGERPFRVVGSSVAVIAAFAVAFGAAWASLPVDPPPAYDGFLGALLLSFESFTTLVLGGGDVAHRTVRLIGYAEGFIGAFLIALFVFTITRSIRR